jgi:hypothetical protein
MKLKTYFLSSLMFLLLIFIFLFVSAGIDYTGELYTNNFDDSVRQELIDIAATRELSSANNTDDPDSVNLVNRGGDKPYLLVGSPMDAAYDSLSWMLKALKLGFQTVEIIPDDARLNAYRGVILAGTSLSALGNLDALFTYVDNGGHVLFSQLPATSGDEQEDFLETVGVLEVDSYVRYEQCEFYEGILLGGMVRYDELPIRARHITISNLCKIWGVMWEGDPDARDDEVPLIFERRYGDGVFCLVNGPFLTENYGVGFLQGLLAIDETALVTPVVNAATLSLVDFPFLDGDPAKLQEVYARDALSTVRDILWIDLSYTITQNDLSATAFIPSSDIEYNVSYEEFFRFLVRSMSESGSELGFMGKLNFESELRDALPDYGFNAIYSAGGELSLGEEGGYATVVTPLEDMTVEFASYSGEVVNYPVLTSGYSDADEMNLITRGYAAGLMMIHHALDMAPPVLLDDPNFLWKDMNDSFTIFLYAALYPYRFIERLSVSNASNSFFTYQLTQPELQYTAYGLTISSGIDLPSTFLLRTRLNPEAVSGLTLTELEEDIYLVNMSGSEGSVRWVDEDNR